MTTATDTTVRYEPRGAARELFKTRASEVAMAGPAGTGKSLACLYRVHFAALNNPGIRCLVVRKTAVSLGSTTLVTFEKKVAAQALASGIVRWYGGSPREAACYRYDNGSVIVVGGMDKPEKVLSAEYDLVFVDEATELAETDWETIGTRLRNGKLSWQQQIAACNPSHPTHWIKQRSDRGGMRMLHSRHHDNPAYVRADGTLTEQGKDYMGKLDALTGVRRLRYRDGIWAAAEGVIYENWDEALHVVDRFEIPPTWTRWLVVDFGFTNPFCAQWWAEDRDGRLYMYREIYRTRRLVEDHARHILKLVTDEHGEWTEPRPRAVICDHDAEDRATLEKHLGMSTAPAKKTVSDGIQAVQSRLKVQEDGRARLVLLRGALVERDPELDAAKKPACTEEEITGYVWAIKPGGDLKEEPVKENDHGMDALRYMVAERDLSGRPRMRWL
ncbi:terminase [Streptomyces roseoverticillatus]|uniref:phage terminase large subunit n=1 Tax=Streptomyces roseoverticillatus TaxID=66429 RepID=UPI001F3B69BC|nr:phage terminase large subunit [Streptomyces roseoverticillatus]MCF3101435.1 terminase [Streptomyces roseoverticillatus]